METVKDWCKRARDLGVLVGVGTHIPEVTHVEEQDWDIDFYAGCVYNRRRTLEEWKRVLHGEVMEMPGDTYMQSDPPRMYAEQDALLRIQGFGGRPNTGARH